MTTLVQIMHLKRRQVKKVMHTKTHIGKTAR